MLSSHVLNHIAKSVDIQDQITQYKTDMSQVKCHLRGLALCLLIARESTSNIQESKKGKDREIFSGPGRKYL